MDVDPSAIEWLAKMMPGERLVTGDAHDLDKLLPNDRFDLIIASDIIEHLPNPGRFLEACRKCLQPNGTLLVTTIKAVSAVRFIKELLAFRRRTLMPRRTPSESITRDGLSPELVVLWSTNQCASAFSDWRPEAAIDA